MIPGGDHSRVGGREEWGVVGGGHDNVGEIAGGHATLLRSRSSHQHWSPVGMQHWTSVGGKTYCVTSLTSLHRVRTNADPFFRPTTWKPRQNAAYLKYMRSYCPYSNLNVGGAKKFPSVFCTAGLSDYRVGYYEGAKWIAKMRSQIREAKEANAEGAWQEPLVIMETNMAAGHGGASGRFEQLKEISRDVAFLAVEFGLIQ